MNIIEDKTTNNKMNMKKGWMNNNPPNNSRNISRCKKWENHYNQNNKQDIDNNWWSNRWKEWVRWCKWIEIEECIEW